MISIIRKEDLDTNKWSGGTTTQLFIYPENSSYAAKNFQYRISTATVDIEESTFTKLSGISRSIMVLDGTMELSHKNQHSVTLNKFETDKFEGDWETTSKGKVTDFNLMTTNGRNGSLDSSTLKKGELFPTSKLHKDATVALYPINGNINLKDSEKDITIQSGDILIMDFSKNLNPTDIRIIANNYSEIAIAIIKDKV